MYFFNERIISALTFSLQVIIRNKNIKKSPQVGSLKGALATILTKKIGFGNW
jgi:hypothetical protein